MSRFFICGELMNGRIRITTDVEQITYENVISVIRDTIGKHRTNARRIQELLDFEEGDQPLIREKKYRADINFEITDNIAN